MKILRPTASIAIALAFVFALLASGCSSDTVAATVNDQEISESTVTFYIQDLRDAFNLKDKSKWADYLQQNNATAQSFRLQVVDYYTTLTLLQQAAAQMDTAVSEEQINAEVAQSKVSFASDKDWKTYLSQYGYTENTYRNSIELGLLQNAIKSKVGESVKAASESEAIQYLQSHVEFLDGSKRSSQIWFSSDDKASAEELLQSIDSGKTTFDDSLKARLASKYNDLDGDAGWNTLSTSENVFTTKYLDTLDQLDVGQTSDLFTDDNGIHIIKCTQEWNAPSKIKSLENIPDEIAAFARDGATEELITQEFQSWLEDYRSKATITVNDMPKSLPYDVETTNN